MIINDQLLLCHQTFKENNPKIHTLKYFIFTDSVTYGLSHVTVIESEKKQSVFKLGGFTPGQVRVIGCDSLLGK